MFKRLLPIILLSSLGFSSQAQNSQPEAISSFNEPDRNSSFINITEIGFARGIIHENRDQSFGLQTINGYEFDNRVSIGIGVGAEKYLGKSDYDNKVSNLTLIPLFTDVRIYFGKGNVQPFVAQAAGYAFCLDQPVDYNFFGEYDEKGGIMLSPSIGLRTNNKAKANFIFSLGYRYQENTQEITEGNYHTFMYYGINADGSQFKRFDHYLTLKFGLTF